MLRMTLKTNKMKQTIIVGAASLLTLSACVSKKHHTALIEKHNKAEQELTALKQENIKQ